MGTIINLAQAPARPAGSGATEAVLVGDSRQIAASLLRLSGGARYIGEVPRGSDQYLFVLLEGRLRFLVNGEDHILAPGQATHFPMNDSHALRSADGQALNFLEFHVPGVFRTNYDG
jgi:quercetin dioxygenase-like cupin family protein